MAYHELHPLDTSTTTVRPLPFQNPQRASLNGKLRERRLAFGWDYGSARFPAGGGTGPWAGRKGCDGTDGRLMPCLSPAPVHAATFDRCRMRVACFYSIPKSIASHTHFKDVRTPDTMGQPIRVTRTPRPGLASLPFLWSARTLKVMVLS